MLTVKTLLSWFNKITWKTNNTFWPVAHVHAPHPPLPLTLAWRCVHNMLVYDDHLPGVCTVKTLVVLSPDPVTRKLPSLQQNKTIFVPFMSSKCFFSMKCIEVTHKSDILMLPKVVFIWNFKWELLSSTISNFLWKIYGKTITWWSNFSTLRILTWKIWLLPSDFRFEGGMCQKWLWSPAIVI